MAVLAKQTHLFIYCLKNEIADQFNGYSIGFILKVYVVLDSCLNLYSKIKQGYPKRNKNCFELNSTCFLLTFAMQMKNGRFAIRGNLIKNALTL